MNEKKHTSVRECLYEVVDVIADILEAPEISGNIRKQSKSKNEDMELSYRRHCALLHNNKRSSSPIGRTSKDFKRDSLNNLIPKTSNERDLNKTFNMNEAKPGNSNNVKFGPEVDQNETPVSRNPKVNLPEAPTEKKASLQYCGISPVKRDGKEANTPERPLETFGENQSQIRSFAQEDNKTVFHSVIDTTIRGINHIIRSLKRGVATYKLDNIPEDVNELNKVLAKRLLGTRQQIADISAELINMGLEISNEVAECSPAYALRIEQSINEVKEVGLLDINAQDDDMASQVLPILHRTV